VDVEDGDEYVDKNVGVDEEDGKK
jgi:hypothetical protein